MWSWASTDTPTVMPRIQWLGSGFGQRGSTSNCGASTTAAATAARFSRTAEMIPSPARRARKAAAIWSLCFIVFLSLFSVARCRFAVMAYPRAFSEAALAHCEGLPFGSANGVDFTPLAFPRVEENDFHQASGLFPSMSRLSEKDGMHP